MEFRRRLAFSGMLENASWGAFVRVETPIDETATEAAERRLQDFAVEVARALPGVLGGAGLTTEGRGGEPGANPVVP
jgi:hypothetical protein